MTKEELETVIDNHKLWISDEQKGKRADLNDANLCGTDLRDAYLRGADLCGVDLRDANLCGANLCDTDLCDANLRGADLCDANLYGTNLCDADLRDAYLRGANLRDAYLRGVDLRGTDLRGTNLRGADLPDKILQVGPIGSRSDYTVYNVTQDIVQCGCWRGLKGGSLDDFEMRVNEAYPNSSRYGDEYRRLITWFKAERDACQKEKAASAVTGSAQ